MLFLIHFPTLSNLKSLTPCCTTIAAVSMTANNRHHHDYYDDACMCLASPQGGYAPWATNRKRGKTEPDSHNYEPDESEVWRMHQAQRHFRDRGRLAFCSPSCLCLFSTFFYIVLLLFVSFPGG